MILLALCSCVPIPGEKEQASDLKVKLKDDDSNEFDINDIGDNFSSPIEAFEASVYQLTRRNCVGCHRDDRLGLPQHANDDVQIAYDQAKARADFNTPSNSRLVIKAGDSHCGQFCQDNSVMLQAVTIWADIEAQFSGGSPQPAPVTPSVSDLNAFQTSVYSYTRALCVSCHASGGLPNHASATPLTAYNAAKPFVDSANISQSRLVIKASDGHCGANCQNAAPMIDAISYWVDFDATF